MSPVDGQTLNFIKSKSWNKRFSHLVDVLYIYGKALVII